MPTTSVTGLNVDNHSSLINQVTLQQAGKVTLSQNDAAHIITISGDSNVYPLNSNPSGYLRNAVTTLNGFNGTVTIFTNSLSGQSSLLINSSSNQIKISLDGPKLFFGSGDPNGIISGNQGSIYTDTFNNTLYKNLNGGTVWNV